MKHLTVGITVRTVSVSSCLLLYSADLCALVGLAQCIHAADITSDGLNEVIVGRDDGLLEVT